MKASLFIVDDVKAIRERLHIALQEEFAILGEASDAQSAEQAIERQQPDLVLLDMVMPGGSGLEVLRAFSRKDKRPHFLVLSGCVQDEVIHEALRLGAFDYLIKPVEDKVLIQALKKPLIKREA